MDKKKRILTVVLSVAAAVVLISSTVFAAVFAVKKGTQLYSKIADEKAAAEDNTAQDETQSESGAVLTKSSATTSTIESTDTTGSAKAYDVSEIVENVMPSVVAITDNLEVTTSQTYNPYSYYFGGYSDNQQQTTQESAASGSGVIIAENDSELLIVTNNHVVDNEGNYTTYSISSTGLTVSFCDGTTADATVKGTDEDMDLAVISVDLSTLSDDTKSAIKIATIGSSDDLEVGNGAIAIGNALGYGQSVTVGVISAKDREVTVDSITRTLLQTDAAINPGNSGGGLFNMNGELIGINCAKYEDTDVEGMGFAIPISSAESIITELMNKVTIPEEEQGYLGINGETVPSTYVERYGYPEGVSVTRIYENSPAETAGLQIYDIITAVDGKAVASMDELKEEVNAHAAGDTVTLTIQRPEGRGFTEITLDVTLVKSSDLQQS